MKKVINEAGQAIKEIITRGQTRQDKDIGRTLIIHMPGNLYKKFRTATEREGRTIEEAINYLIIDRLQEIEFEADEQERD